MALGTAALGTAATALALGIVEVVKFPVVRIVSPMVLTALQFAPPDMRLDDAAAKNWSITIVDSALVLITVIFAWYLQVRPI